MKLDLSDTAGIRLLSEAADAERCWQIYRNPVAAARPGLAWALLPTGKGVTDTLLHLIDLPIEDDAPAQLHADYLAALTTRRDRAVAAWIAYQAPMEKPAHVH